MYRDYQVPADLQPRPSEAGRMVGWGQILPHWRLVVADLSEVYGIHFETTTVPWPGLRDRIVGLVASEKSRLRDALAV